MTTTCCVLCLSALCGFGRNTTAVLIPAARKRTANDRVRQRHTHRRCEHGQSHRASLPARGRATPRAPSSNTRNVHPARNYPRTHHTSDERWTGGGSRGSAGNGTNERGSRSGVGVPSTKQKRVTNVLSSKYCRKVAVLVWANSVGIWEIKYVLDEQKPRKVRLVRERRKKHVSSFLVAPTPTTSTSLHVGLTVRHGDQTHARDARRDGRRGGWR